MMIDTCNWQPGSRCIAAILFVGALVLRLAVTAAVPALSIHSNDAIAYRDLAHNLLHRGEFVTRCDPPHSDRGPYVMRPPLVSLSLALTYRLLGERAGSERLLLALLGALACVAVYALGTTLFDQRVGLAAAAIAMCYPFFFVLSAVPLTESWDVLLYPLLAWSLVRLRRLPGSRPALAVGLVLGLAALCKAVILGVLPVLPWVLSSRPGWREWLRSARQTSLVMGIAALAIMPWTIRNYLALGRFVPVNAQAGWVALQGSGPTAKYALDRLEMGLSNGWDNPVHLGELLPRQADPVTWDRAAAGVALHFVRQHPGEFLSLAWRKERLLWSAYPNWAHRLSWAFVALLTLWGLALTWEHRRELLPIYLLVAHTVLVAIFFTSMPRFRAPIEPLLMLFAGVALVRAAELLRCASRRLSALQPGNKLRLRGVGWQGER